MIDAARSNGIKLMVGQVLRYYEPYRSILRWNADKRFGRVHAASIWRITDGRRWAVDGYWRASHAKSGGYLLEISAHELDMLRCLMGQPSDVYAIASKFLPRRQEMEDYISATIRFRDGGAANYEGGGGTSVSRYGFRLYFEGATLMSDAAFDPEALRIYDTEGQPVDTLHAEMSPEDPVEAELRDWLAALRGEKPVVIPGEEGLATVAVAQAAYQSIETGRPVSYTSVLS
jgi:predicted dehydrogenase